VSEDAQGLGIGTALIHAAEEHIGTRGHAIVTIGVGLNNRRAAALYERLGYRDTGIHTTSRYTLPDVDGEVVEHDTTLAKRLG
jgi:ribosomal protein S18 acetylase RimI-like enzyme